MKKIAIVILNYNTFEDTVKCINSIKDNVTEEVNIYIVDNASSDNSGNTLYSYYQAEKNIKVLLSKKNLGFSGGNNIGIRAALNADCDFIFLLNSDILLCNDAIRYMLDTVTNNKNVEIVGPQIFNSKGQYSQFARRGISLKAYLLDKKFIDKIFHDQIGELRFINYDRNKDFVFNGMVSGCCFGLSSDFIKNNKCLDDNVFMYYEEDILAYLLAKCCKQAAVSSKAKVIHNEGVSTSKSNSDKLLFTRFYRWTSSLYVLYNYAKVDYAICKIISTFNILTWLVLACVKKTYKNRLKDFINENRRVLEKM